MRTKSISIFHIRLSHLFIRVSALFLLVLFSFRIGAQHPSIMLTVSKLAEIKKGVESIPLLRESYLQVKQMAEKALKVPVSVPKPADGGGGYTHEQHKQNYQSVLASGICYQITEDRKYADYVRKTLLAYASQYESWPLHPARKSSNPAGRIFWQNLNDCVWLVYVIQGYDLVYTSLSPKDHDSIEQHLFIPMVKFLMEDNSETFNRIHNHGTWSVAAVGMTGYVLHRKDWVEKALKGSLNNQSSGFLAQIRKLFSPDGYYTEGPYYQRYALLPFLLFAHTINHYDPALAIYNYGNCVLKKAIQTSLQLTYTTGAFFPINDALKDKTYESEELVYGVDLAYTDMEHDGTLLDVAKKQNRVIVSDAGLEVAKAIAEGKSKSFAYKSLWISDGNQGDEGGLGILRYGPNSDQQCALLKASAQGMGHGHFDKLNFLMYDHGGEVFADYGSARFLNIETKSGGEYLPENKTWAKQTVAHNTLVIDQKSHFNGDLDKAQASHPDLVYFDTTATLKVVSADEKNAYKGGQFNRTLIQVKLKELARPLVIDICKVNSESEHQYDLPYWYEGQITNTPFKVVSNTAKLEPLGTANGYQHIWLNAVGHPSTGYPAITFLQNSRFYTINFLADSALAVDFITVGANDPNFNLRNEKGIVFSRAKSKNTVFISLIESHGNTDPIAETTTDYKGKVSNLKLLEDDAGHCRFQFMVKEKQYNATIQYRDKKNFITIQ